MIQPLRTIHRWVFTTFAVLLPAVVIAAVANRHEYMTPGRIRAEVSIGETRIASEHRQFRLIRNGGSFELLPTFDTPHPELLVYWSPESAISSVPENAHLLGQYEPATQFRLVGHDAGTIILYSPAQNSIIDSISLGRPR